MYYKDLYLKSIEVIKSNQSNFGLYIASPEFENYKYCWLRDGTFIAYSMDLCGNNSSSRKYYCGINNILKVRSKKVKQLIDIYNKNGFIDKKKVLPARFTLEGKITKTDWSEFQIDGYGIFLWGLVKHLEITGELNLLETTFKNSIDIVIKYLTNFWIVPNYDCWEENGDKINTSTIVCVYGGLKSILNIKQNKIIKDSCDKIRAFFHDFCVKSNHIIKYIGTESVDASLLWSSVPFGIVDVEDSIMLNTVKKIESSLLKTGLKRYYLDEYYGGGEWPLLTAFLGWYYLTIGNIKEAKEMLKLVLKSADDNYMLPEQKPSNLYFPEKYYFWKNKWGEIAKPLLWSHAMYVILYSLLQIERSNEG